MTLHFLNDVANDTESTKRKIKKLRQNRCLISEIMGKLINRIPDLRLLISSYQARL